MNPESEVTLLYETILERGPDPEGLSTYSQHIRNGMSLEKLTQCLKRSQEHEKLVLRKNETCNPTVLDHDNIQQISVLLVVRDSVASLIRTIANIELCAHVLHLEATYYVYGNDLPHNTQQLLSQQFQECYKNKFHLITESAKNPILGHSEAGQRMKHMANIRNNLLSLRPFRGKLALLIDMGVFLPPLTLLRMIRECCCSNVGMVAAHGIVADRCEQGYEGHSCLKYHYYDTMAFTDLKGRRASSYVDGTYKRSCTPFSQDHGERYATTQQPISVETAFGSCSLVRTEVLNSPDFCWSFDGASFPHGVEHHSLCRAVRTLGWNIKISHCWLVIKASICTDKLWSLLPVLESFCGGKNFTDTPTSMVSKSTRLNDDDNLKIGLFWQTAMYISGGIFVDPSITQHEGYFRLFSMAVHPGAFHLLAKSVYVNDTPVDGLSINQHCVQRHSTAESHHVLVLGEPYKHVEILKQSGCACLFSFFEFFNIPRASVEIINKNASALFVPLPFFQKGCIASGINIPVKIVTQPVIANARKTPMQSWTGSGTFHVGVIGTPVDRKHVTSTIAAVVSLAKHNSIMLHIHVGRFYTEEMHSRFQSLCDLHKDCVTLTHSEMSEEEKVQWFEQLHLYVCASGAEGFSIPPREAMRLAIPVAVTDIPAHAELIDSGFVHKIKPSSHTSQTQCDYHGGDVSVVEPTAVEEAIHTALQNYTEVSIPNAMLAAKWCAYRWLPSDTEYQIVQHMKSVYYPKTKKTSLLKVSFWFPHCFLQEAAGCHSRAMQQLQWFVDRNYEILVCSFSDIVYLWDDCDDHPMWNHPKVKFLVHPRQTNNDWLIYGIKEFQPDIVFWSYNPEAWQMTCDVLQLRKLMPAATFILETHDIVNVNIDQLQRMEASPKHQTPQEVEMWSKITFWDTYNSVPLDETDAVLRADVFDIVIAISRLEAAYLQARVSPSTHVVLVEMTWPFLENADMPDMMCRGTSGCFVASDNMFNVFGIVYFIRFVLPLLPACMTIHIAGTICDVKEVIKIIDESKYEATVCMHGRIENILDIYKISRVSICPLLLGTGAKTKIYEAFACGIPVVGMSASCDHSIMQHGHHGYIADNHLQFAEFLTGLVTDPEQCSVFGQNARSLLRSTVDTQTVDFFGMFD